MKTKICTKKAAFLAGIYLSVLLFLVGGALAVAETVPISVWNLNESSGTNAPDSVGSDDGTLINTPTWTTGKLNNALDFDQASNEYVTTPLTVDDLTSSWTYTAWFKTSKDYTGTYGFLFGALDDQTPPSTSDPFIQVGFYTGRGTTENRLTAAWRGDGSGNWEGKETSVDANDGAWRHIAIVFDGSDLTLYMNGTEQTDTIGTTAVGNLDGDEPIPICSYNERGSYYFHYDGMIDDVRFYDVELNATEISQIYNSGNGCEYGSCDTSPPGPGAPNHYTVSVTNLYNDTDLSGVTVTFAPGCTNTTGVSGDATVTNQSAGCSAITGTLSAVNLSKTGFAWNESSYTIPPNGTDNAGGYQGLVNITAVYRLIDGAQLGYALDTWTVNTSGGKTYQECSGTYPCNIYLADGANTLTLQSTNYYDKNFQVNITAPETTTTTVSGVYDALLSVTAIDYWTNASINTFTVNASNASESFTTLANTTNGTAEIPGVQGFTYFLEIDASGYALANETISLTNSTPFYEFTLYTTNSVTIYFWDEYTGASITQNVTVEFDGPNSTFESTGTGGYLYEDLLDPGTWTLTMDSDGYDERVYYITVSTRSHQVLNAYLLNSTLSQDTTFYIKDSDGDNLPNSTITIQDDINGSWTTIAQKTTDFFGIAYFPLQYAHTYRAIIEAPGYITKTAEFERVLTSYTIRLSSNNTQDYTSYGDEFTYSTSPDEVKPEPTNFTLSTSSPLGALEWFSVTTLLNGSTTTTNNTGSPSGGTATVAHDLTSYSGDYIEVWYKAKSTGINTPLVLYGKFLIYSQTPGNYSLAAFAEHYDTELSSEEDEGKAKKAIIVVLAAVIVALSLGLMISTSAGGVGAAVVFIVASAVDWLSWSITIVVGGALILGAFLGRDR